MNPVETAQEVRYAYYGDPPYADAIDPVFIARQLGLNVYSAELENSLSGMIAKMRPDEEPDIFLNSNHAPVRQRFTCAHELGHYFQVKDLPENAPTYVHKRDSRSACGVYEEEVYANGFAAELLMPASEVVRLRNIGSDVYHLAKRFQVSVDAMTNRLNALRNVAV